MLYADAGAKQPSKPPSTTVGICICMLSPVSSPSVSGFSDSLARIGLVLTGPPLPGVRVGMFGKGLVGVLLSVPASPLLLRIRPELPLPRLVPSSALPLLLPRDPTKLLLGSRPPPDSE